MDVKPLFSVLIANYNNAAYIKTAIESVIEQTYENWEILIVDDKSTDDSLHVIESFLQDKRIKLYTNTENLGCGHTKVLTENYAKGEICGYLDPDDALTRNALEVMVKAHLKNKDASLVSSSHYICNEYLEIEREAYGANKIPNGESYLSYGSGITHFATFKKKYYSKTSGIDISYKRAVDQDLYYKLEEVGKVVFIDEPLYYYRIHESGISTFKNLSKSRYWFVLAKKAAYERRKHLTSVKNITYNEIKSWESIYLITKASDCFNEWKIASGISLLIKGFSKKLIDKYILLKIKTIFLNTFLHRVLKKLK